MQTILKISDNIINSIQKELQKSSEVYVDEVINRRVDREVSHLGKENLIADHIANLTKNYGKTKKNNVLFLLVKLYNINKQVNQSLSLELKNDKKLLDKRIKTRENKAAYKDVYNKLLKIADKHYKVVEDYAKHFNPKKKYSNFVINNVVYHKRKAEAIYKELANVKMRKTLHSILLTKLDKVYQSLMISTVNLANSIANLTKNVKNNNVKALRTKAEEIDNAIASKLEVLKDFAYKYTFNIIHSDHFLDFDGNKLVLVTKKDHK